MYIHVHILFCEALPCSLSRSHLGHFQSRCYICLWFFINSSAILCIHRHVLHQSSIIFVYWIWMCVMFFLFLFPILPFISVHVCQIIASKSIGIRLEFNVCTAPNAFAHFYVAFVAMLTQSHKSTLTKHWIAHRPSKISNILAIKIEWVRLRDGKEDQNTN